MKSMFMHKIVENNLRIAGRVLKACLAVLIVLGATMYWLDVTEQAEGLLWNIVLVAMLVVGIICLGTGFYLIITTVLATGIVVKNTRREEKSE